MKISTCDVTFNSLGLDCNRCNWGLCKGWSFQRVDSRSGLALSFVSRYLDTTIKPSHSFFIYCVSMGQSSVLFGGAIHSGKLRLFVGQWHVFDPNCYCNAHDEYPSYVNKTAVVTFNPRNMDVIAMRTFIATRLYTSLGAQLESITNAVS